MIEDDRAQDRRWRIAAVVVAGVMGTLVGACSGAIANSPSPGGVGDSWVGGYAAGFVLLFLCLVMTVLLVLSAIIFWRRRRLEWLVAGCAAFIAATFAVSFLA